MVYLFFSWTKAKDGYPSSCKKSKRQLVAFFLKKEQTNSQQEVESTTYHYNGNLLTGKTENGVQTAVSYDRLGRPTKYKNEEVEYGYRNLLDRIGNVEYTYDILGRRTSKKKGEHLTQYEYKGGELSKIVIDGTEYKLTNDRADGLLKFGDYLLVRNIQGDVIALVSDDGVVAKYTYDAWGVPTVRNPDGTVNTDTTFIGNINPFRYRSYLYDTENNLYYLQSRYYDPYLSRFLTLDSTDYLDPEVLGGLNLYAYCNNNPVMYADPSGHFPWLIIGIIAAAVLFTPVGGTIFQVTTSALSYAGIAIGAIFDEEIRNDMNAIGWNPFNGDEASVLNSRKVSFYKGVPVIRTAEGNRSGSFGAIFLSKGSDVDTLRHERGHNWQLMMMGVGTYAFTVGIPSPLILGKWGKKNYYGSPWETMADILGGVQTRNHSKEEIANAWHYYAVSTICFPLTVLYWF